MNIPGFTAEASVYKTPGNYQMAGTPNDLAGNRGVVPQMSAPCNRMFRRCIQATGGGFEEAEIYEITWCNLYENLGNAGIC
jgi:hypothetical protein